MHKPTLYSRRVVLGTGSDSDPLRVCPAALRIGDDGIIVAVDEVAVPPSGDEVVDLGEKLVTPAFVNGHTHLSMSSLRGIDAVGAMRGNVVEDLYFAIESLIEPEDVRAFVRMGAYESALAGVGCVWDHYYYACDVARGLEDVGLSGVVAPTLQDIDGPGTGVWEAQLDAAATIDDDERLARAGIVAALGPHATDTVSDELWARCAEMADARDLWLHVHVGQSFDELARSIERHGCTPVERLRRAGWLDAGRGMLLVHMMFATDADLRAFDPQRHVLGYCPFSQVQFGFPAHVLAWHEAEVPFTLGTDCGACNDSMSVQGELRILAGGSAFATTHSDAYEAFRTQGSLESARATQRHRQAIFERYEALKHPQGLLRAVWDIPGQMHPDLRVGVLAAGARANIAVWKQDHPGLWPARDPLRALAFGDTTTTLHAMMLGGDWFGTPGDMRRSVLESDRYQAHREEADARLDALLERAGVELPFA